MLIFLCCTQCGFTEIGHKVHIPGACEKFEVPEAQEFKEEVEK